MKSMAYSSSKSLPDGLTVEEPARNLASLATTVALEDLSRVVLAQWSRHEQFGHLAKHGIRPVDRLLFYGPPGNGKTMAAQWLSTKLGAPLYRVRCEAVVSAYLGQTSSNMGRIMEWLATQPRCVVLFDEIDQLFRSRESMRGGGAQEYGSAMSVFWQYLDRWKAPTLFILATNLPDYVDAALRSRIDVQLEFGPPTPEQVASVIRYWQEVLHEYGGDEWGPILSQRTNYESFRALFYEIQNNVRGHVANGSAHTAGASS
jgi:SpoVK/Ycf46/Vps4 family AAA+-type ATPase